MINAALILEGGSLRSVYTAGVLDVMMENGLEFAYVIGTSSGALCAGNYIAKEIGRSARINIMHSNDRNYFGFGRYFKTGSIFNYDYLYNEPINRLYPYAEDRFLASKQRFVITATNCNTGEAEYFEKHTYDEMTNALTASSSIPLLTKIAYVDGIPCLDGSGAAPIGLHKAIADENEKIIIVLTRDLDYKKDDVKAIVRFFLKRKYKRYPQLVERLLSQPQLYNKLIEEIRELEKQKKVFIVRPSKPLKIRQTERDARTLFEGYLRGRDNMLSLLPDLKNYLEEKTKLECL